MYTYRQHQKGFALLLALIVSSVVLAIGLVILEISINQINLSATARESEIAFQAAHAGIDCIWYWRNEEATSFTADSGGAPSIQCFNTSPITTAVPTTLESGSDGHARAFEYTFEWGDPIRCTVVDAYVINAYGGDMSLNFANEAIGDDGVKDCNEGNVCTVLIAGGYNRACDEVGTGVFSVQREIVVEF